MKKITLVIALLLINLISYAQYRNLSLKDYKTWSIQGNISNNWAHTDVVNNNLFYSNVNYNLGYGLRLNKFLTHNFGLAVDASKTKFYGENENSSYSSNVNYQVSLLGILQTGNIRFIDAFKNFQLYGYLGYGTVNYEASYTNKTNPNWNNSVKENAQVIPAGLGLKYHLKENVTLNLEYAFNNINSDDLDAFNDAVTEYDNYSRIQFGISYTIGNKDDVVLEWHDPRPRYVPQPVRKDTVFIVQNNPTIDSNLLADLQELKNIKKLDSLFFDSLEVSNSRITIFYEFNKYSLPSVYHNKLGEISLNALNRSDYKIIIESYTDTIGSPENNKIIVERRSSEIYNYYTSIGVPKDKMEIKLHDESSAILPSDAENRKSIIYIKK